MAKTIGLFLVLTVLAPCVLAEDFTVEKWIGPPGLSGLYDGVGTAAQLGQPMDVARDAAGNLYVLDQAYKLIRRIDPSGAVTTLAGPDYVNENGQIVSFGLPYSIAVDAGGFVFVNDTSAILRISPAGVVRTLTSVTGANDLAIDKVGNLYVTSSNNVIYKVTPAGVKTEFAGSAGQAGTTDGVGTAARFQSPFRITIDNQETLIVVDGTWFGGGVLRKITKDGVVSTISGSIPWVGGIAAGAPGT
ncbi:MAG TPA: hypothetical protein VF787_01770, partial [Thermoanaerobaculia bacterium]